MVLKTFDVANISRVRAVPLTPELFAPYGGVISADHQIKHVKSLGANYGTAVKIHKVAPITNNYPASAPATANWNIYRCKAPKHLITHSGAKSTYKLTVLERHPYTTQTFVPMGENLDKVAYLVIVAATDANDPQKLPEPSQIKAFICKGNQAVTYGVGTWHAPMVVIDEDIEHLDFAVMMHENGVADDDCQECYFEPGYEIEYTVNALKL